MRLGRMSNPWLCGVHHTAKGAGECVLCPWVGVWVLCSWVGGCVGVLCAHGWVGVCVGTGVCAACPWVGVCAGVLCAHGWVCVRHRLFHIEQVVTRARVLAQLFDMEQIMMHTAQHHASHIIEQTMKRFAVCAHVHASGIGRQHGVEQVYETCRRAISNSCATCRRPGHGCSHTCTTHVEGNAE